MPSPGATTNLTLPYLEAAQAQKHVTVNETLRLLDALVQANAISRTLTAQPASPADGDLYILPAGKTGARWGAMGNGALAYFRDGVWAQIAPREGWTVFVRDEDQHVVYSGAAWGPILSAAQTAGFRNRLINSAFAVNQRGLTSVADDAYGFDRWYVLTSSGAVTLGPLVDPESGRPTGLRLTQPDASPKRIGLAQIVESADIRDLRSKAAAMGARVRCSSSQAVRIAILEWTGAADAVTSDVVANWTSSVYSPGAFFQATTLNVIATGAATATANTWTDLTPITGAFGGSMTNAIVMVWTEGALAQNATLDLDQVQLEPGAICGAFARRPVGEELALCQRFYHSRTIAAAGKWYASTSAALGVQFPVTMRATPTATLLNSTPTVSEPGLGDRIGSGSTLFNVVLSPKGGKWDINGFTGATAGGPAMLFTDDVIGFSAEL